MTGWSARLADLVVLGQDPLTIAPERLREISIERTIVGWREIYSTTGARPTAASRK